MRTPEVIGFIQKHSDLFWYTPQEKKDEISDEFLVESILNYGTLNDFKELEKLMGRDKLATTFLSMEGRKKLNIYPELYNFFYHYFKRYAQRDIK